MSRPSRVAVPDKREAILKAAVKIFAKKGYFNSKVSDIASEAGIADGTVYLYFKSKDEVLRSVFDRTMEDFISEGRAELVKISSPAEKLKWLAHFHLRKLGADRDLAIVFQVELRGSTKFMEEFSEKGFRQYLDVIKKVIEEGHHPDHGCKDFLRSTRRNGYELDSFQEVLSIGTVCR
jgi:TetR/AcrR family fatty acid metabolism transcriptional regulator